MLGDLLGFLFGSVEGVATIAVLLTVGRWARKGAVIGDWMSMAGLVAIIIGVLALTGGISIHPGVVIDLVMSLLRFATGVLPGLLPF